MIFSSSIFVFIFLPIVIFLYYVTCRGRVARNILLLIASLGFYAWSDLHFVLILLISITGNYLFALGIDLAKWRVVLKRSFFVAMIVMNIGILYVFKYLMFSISIVNKLFDKSITIPTIALPIGISFFTFQAISYCIDVYRGRTPVQKNPLKVALYISFFPQLVAGPIVRYQTVALQLSARKESLEDFRYGCYRFVTGLCKKVLIANQFGALVDQQISNIGMGGGVALSWLLAIAYTFQIYFDFSGYSDMAIGLGRMFGFHFEENFNHPYVSKSITEFWRRWHISLGSWFRDYVYFPLGGSRVKSTKRLVFNLFVVWMLTGIWHGANFTFILWGLIYTVFIITEKLIAKHVGISSVVDLSQTANRSVRILLHVYTLLIVVLGWVIFRSDSIGFAKNWLISMFGFAGDIINDATIFLLQENLVLLVVAAILCTPLVHRLIERVSEKALGQVVISIILMMLFVFAISNMVKETYNPFIYFNF